MILICLLYTCAVWIESVDPVADLRLTNQVLYGTILYPVLLNNLSRAYAIPLLVLNYPKLPCELTQKINRDRRARLVSSNRARFAHYTNISHSLYAGGPINASSGFGLWAKTLRGQLCKLGKETRREWGEAGGLLTARPWAERGSCLYHCSYVLCSRHVL